MEIIPFVGFNDIKFGYSKDEVKKIIGTPDTTESVQFPDGSSTDSWMYNNLEIELNFDSDEEYRLSRITFYSPTAVLEGVCVIGKSEEELVKCFPKVYLDETNLNSGGNYEYLEKDISFWVVDGVVANFTLFVQFDETRHGILWP